MKLCSLMSEIGVVTDSEREVSGIVSDSNSVIPGNVFVCVSGGCSDGHLFALEASRKGASAIVFERGRRLPGEVECPVFSVENTRLALSKLLAAWYGNIGEHLKTVAVTGTNGKTSTVAFLAAAIGAGGALCGRIGTLSCFLGDKEIPVSQSGTHAFTTPDQDRFYKVLYEMANSGAEYAVTEASSHALAQYRLDGINPDVAVFLNLSREHLDFHGSMENYFEAKARLFSLSKRGLVNADNSSGRRIKELYPWVKTFGKSADADFRGTDVTFDGGGVEYNLVYSEGEFHIRSSVMGSFTFENTMAAASAALMLGIPAEHIERGIASVDIIRGRMEKVAFNRSVGFDAYIDYAHTPEALEKVLLSARGFVPSGKKIILLFGCGGDRDRSKRPVMGRIATALASVTVVTSDNPRSEPRERIIKDILRGIDREKPYKVISDRRDAIEFAVSLAEEGDVILLCGKGHEQYEIDENGKHPFDEAEILRSAVRRKK